MYSPLEAREIEKVGFGHNRNRYEGMLADKEQLERCVVVTVKLRSQSPLAIVPVTVPYWNSVYYEKEVKLS